MCGARKQPARPAVRSAFFPGHSPQITNARTTSADAGFEFLWKGRALFNAAYGLGPRWSQGPKARLARRLGTWSAVSVLRGCWTSARNRFRSTSDGKSARPDARPSRPKGISPRGGVLPGRSVARASDHDAHVGSSSRYDGEAQPAKDTHSALSTNTKNRSMHARRDRFRAKRKQLRNTLEAVDEPCIPSFLSACCRSRLLNPLVSFNSCPGAHASPSRPRLCCRFASFESAASDHPC